MGRMVLIVLSAAAAICVAGCSSPVAGAPPSTTTSPPATYTVTYDGNNSTGGAAPVDSKSYKQGQTVTVLGNTGNLVRADYTFSGWNTKANGSGTGYSAGATFTMGSANLTLYAQWVYAQPSFLGEQTFGTGTGSYPVGLVTTDINQDGKPDVAVVDSAGKAVFLLNTTASSSQTASFAALKTFTLASSTGTPSAIATADFNGDGKPDLALSIMNGANSGTLQVLMNNTTKDATTPSFASLGTYSTQVDPSAVAVADINGDQKPDIIVANAGSASISVFLNTSTSTTTSFASGQTISVGNTPKQLATADVNSDGKPDLIVTDSGTHPTVLINTTTKGASTASFSSTSLTAVPQYSVGVTTPDLNGDTKPDLVFANSNNSNGLVLLNTTSANASTPSFSTPQTVSSGLQPESAQSGEINGDAVPDVVIGNYYDGTVTVYLNKTSTNGSSASLTSGKTFTVGTKPDQIAIADINGDGKSDIITADSGSADISVLLNQTN